MITKMLLTIIILLLVICFFYKQAHVRKQVIISKPIEKSGLKNMDFGTLNGCGSSLYGGFSTVEYDVKIYYVMLSVLFIPLIPIGVIAASPKRENGNIFLASTEYNVYGTTIYDYFELFYCYFSRWGFIALLVILSRLYM